MTVDDNPVARNRATPSRGAPGRPGVGDDVTRRLLLITAAVVVAATLALVFAVVRAA